MKININEELKQIYAATPELLTTDSINKNDIKLLLGGMIDIINFGMNYYPIIPLKIYLSFSIENGYKKGQVTFTIEVADLKKININSKYEPYSEYSEFYPKALFYKVGFSNIIFGFYMSLINSNLDKDMILDLDSPKLKKYLLYNLRRVFDQSVEIKIYNEIIGQNIILEKEQREIIKQKLILLELIHNTIKDAIKKNKHILLNWNFKALCTTLFTIWLSKQPKNHLKLQKLYIDLFLHSSTLLG